MKENDQEDNVEGETSVYPSQTNTEIKLFWGFIEYSNETTKEVT